MNALRFTQKGPIENLRLSQIPKPTLSAGEALVRIRAAGINSSDSVGIQGWLPVTTVPRIPGRDYSGEVVEVADESAKEWMGAEVWGTGGSRGFAYDGSFAEYMKVKVAELSKKPKSLDHVQSASLGLSWLCAWIAIEHSSTTKPGDKVLVIGARGGIGSAVAQLLRAKGAGTIYGTYRSIPASHPSYITPIALTNHTAIQTHLKDAGDFGSIDTIIDCAGWEAPLNDGLKAMKDKGQVVVMAVHSPDGIFKIDLRSFYMKALTLRGLKSSVLNGLQVKEMLDYLAAKFDDGTFDGPRTLNQVRLMDEAAVHQALKDTESKSGNRNVIVV